MSGTSPDPTPASSPGEIANLRAMPRPAMRFRMARDLARGWWLFLLRGVLGVLFGLYAFLAPGLGLAVILGVLAAWLALDGVFSLWQAITGRAVMPGAAPAPGGRLWLALEGAVSLIAAVLIFTRPVTAAVTIVLLVGAWMIASGVMRIVLAVRAGSWLLGLSGLFGVLVGLWLVVSPGPGLLALIWLVAAQAVAAGVLLIGLALRLRRINDDPTPG